MKIFASHRYFWRLCLRGAQNAEQAEFSYSGIENLKDCQRQNPYYFKY